MSFIYCAVYVERKREKKQKPMQKQKINNTDFL